MIILDTNQLRAAKTLTSPVLVALRAIAAQSGHRLALPDVSFDEYMAYCEHELQSRIDRYRQSHNELSEWMPEWSKQRPVFGDLQVAVMDWENRLRQMFDILPCPPEAARTALRMEARREKPASTNWEKPGEGARDAAIWLTVIDACNAESSVVFFVSNDIRAFGVKAGAEGLAPELAAGAPKNLVYCPSVDPLLARLGKKLDLAIPVEELCGSAKVLDAVRQFTSTIDLLNEARYATKSIGHGYVAQIPEVDTYNLVSSGRAQAYVVSDVTLVSFNARWRISLSFAWRPSTPTAVFTASNVRGSRIRRIVQYEVGLLLLLQCDVEGNVTSAEVAGRGPIELTDESAFIVG